MGLEIKQTLEGTVQRLASPTGLLVFVGFAAFRLFEMVMYETAWGAAIEWTIDNYGGQIARQYLGYDVRDSQVTVERLHMELLQHGYPEAAAFLQQATSSGLDLSLPVVLAFLVAFPFVADLLHVLGVRAIAAAGPDTDGLPTGELLSGLPVVYLRSLVANFLAWLCIALGLVLGSVLLFVPGLLLAMAFLFVRQRIVLDGDGIVASLSNSYGLFREHLGTVLVVFGITLFLGVFSTWGISLGSGFVAPMPGWLYKLFTTGVIVFNMALITSAYLQFERPSAA
ncbi:hypothetical protein [Haloarchaeobius baliensis]|uniref:hypothetical protein n=1 Tax=Haloarchaeobius baliensis TaxID=1670458 RepID=UPI003F885897